MRLSTSGYNVSAIITRTKNSVQFITCRHISGYGIVYMNGCVSFSNLIALRAGLSAYATVVIQCGRCTMSFALKVCRLTYLLGVLVYVEVLSAIGTDFFAVICMSFRYGCYHSIAARTYRNLVMRCY